MLVSATEDRRRSPSNCDLHIPKETSVPMHCTEGWMDLKAGMRKVVTIINKTPYGDQTHIFILTHRYFLFTEHCGQVDSTPTPTAGVL
jgi:hypothetical protein